MLDLAKPFVNPDKKVETEEDFNRILDEELQKLQTDHIDVYLLHALNLDRWAHVQKKNILAISI